MPWRGLVSTVLAVFIIAATCTTSRGQAADDAPTITAEDARRHMAESCYLWEVHAASRDDGTPRAATRLQEQLQEVIDRIDDGDTYDLTEIRYSRRPVASGIARINTLPVGSAPGGEQLLDKGAGYVEARTTEDGYEASYFYSDVRPDGHYLYGRVGISRFERGTMYDVPVRRLAFPLTPGASWSYMSATNDSVHAEVVGHGRVILPHGEAPSLVLRRDVFEADAAESAAPRSTLSFETKHGGDVAGVELDEHGEPRRVYYTVRTDTLAGRAPEGQATYCTSLGSAYVSFAHPRDWRVVNLYPRTLSVKGLVVVRDPATVEELIDGDVGTALSDTARLVTADNVVVGISMHSAGEQPEAYVRSVIEQPSLVEPEVIQQPAATSVNGHDAFEAHVRGTDADGQGVVQRQIAYTVGDVLTHVSVLHPYDPPDDVRQAVHGLLDHLVVVER